jgi:hypothetical protein
LFEIDLFFAANTRWRQIEVPKMPKVPKIEKMWFNRQARRRGAALGF